MEVLVVGRIVVWSPHDFETRVRQDLCSDVLGGHGSERSCVGLPSAARAGLDLHSEVLVGITGKDTVRASGVRVETPHDAAVPIVGCPSRVGAGVPTLAARIPARAAVYARRLGLLVRNRDRRDSEDESEEQPDSAKSCYVNGTHVS